MQLSRKRNLEKLIKIWDIIEAAIDEFFRRKGAYKVFLFLVTQGVSSPIAPGSDSEPVKLKEWGKNVYLVDSSQFGLEYIIQHTNYDKVFCILPSFRNDTPDHRHLNQFYHTEAELVGTLKDAMDIAEELIKHLILSLIGKSLIGNNLTNKLKQILNENFPTLTYDEAVKILTNDYRGEGLKLRNGEYIITNKGEKLIAEKFYPFPVWITHYPRILTPFYQKPSSKRPDRVLNADLVVPSLTPNGFYGEILGLGERQNKAEEILNTLKIQNISNIKAYEWYIRLRQTSNYKNTAGFGLGLERFLAWIINKKNIDEVSIFPVKKDKIIY